jgi:hypothetical protein
LATCRYDSTDSIIFAPTVLIVARRYHQCLVGISFVKIGFGTVDALKASAFPLPATKKLKQKVK